MCGDNSFCQVVKAFLNMHCITVAMPSKACCFVHAGKELQTQLAHTSNVCCFELKLMIAGPESTQTQCDSWQIHGCDASCSCGSIP